MIKRKQGENEALEILENIGIEMDEEYTDDNSRPKMPDLRYKDGRFIEVTHTRYNTEFIQRLRNQGCKAVENDKAFSSEECNQSDCPIIKQCTDAILREIIDDKGKKYPYGDTDLFLFVTTEEYRNMLNLMPQWKWNGEANIFLYDIEKSPFQTIYVCEWDFKNLIYNTVDPKMTRFYRNDGTLQWQYYRHKELFCEKVVQ